MEDATDEMPVFSRDDSVTLPTKVEFAAWTYPKHAAWVVPSDDDFTFSAPIPLERLEQEVVDGLAMQWLDHLYASLARKNPFTKTDG
jgi:hypothetical protein